MVELYQTRVKCGQAERSVDVQAYLHAWLERVKIPGAVRLTIDIDPVSFF